MSVAVKQEIVDSTYTQGDFIDENADNPSVPKEKTSIKKSPTKRRAPKKVAVKRQKNEKHNGKQAKTKTSETVKEEVLQQIDEEAEVDPTNPVETNLIRDQTIYTCKLCQKDFSSAFILCLHLQIHQKVGSAPVIKDDTFENLSAPETEGEYEQENDIIDVKLEQCEQSNNPSDNSQMEVKEEPCDSNSNPVNQILNKNFVENLKKNLSLAMNRKM